MERRQADYSILEQQALQLLTSQDIAEYSHLILTAHILVMPSFGNYTSWLVYSDNEQKDFRCKRILWDKQFDSRRFFDPMAGLKYGWNTAPTMRTETANLPGAGVHDWLIEAKSIRVPEPAPSNHIVLDGTDWSVFVPQAFDNKPCRWNVEPSEWQHLIEWTARFVGFLDDHFSPNS